MYSSQNIIYLCFGGGSSKVYKKRNEKNKRKKYVKNNSPLQIVFSKTRDGNPRESRIQNEYRIQNALRQNEEKSRVHLQWH